MKEIKDRETIRINDVERAELKLFMESYQLETPSEAYKVAVKWVNSYIRNVTDSFFPPGYELILRKKLKTDTSKRRVY